MDLKEYISTVNQKYRAGNATDQNLLGTSILAAISLLRNG